MDCGTTDIGKGKRKKDYAKSHCPHGKQKPFCIPCGGNGICEHQRIKYTCTDCDGRQLCKIPHCPTRKKPKYDGHSSFCYVYKFPDTHVARKYMTKENTDATFL